MRALSVVKDMTGGCFVVGVLKKTVGQSPCQYPTKEKLRVNITLLARMCCKWRHPCLSLPGPFSETYLHSSSSINAPRTQPSNSNPYPIMCYQHQDLHSVCGHPGLSWIARCPEYKHPKCHGEGVKVISLPKSTICPRCLSSIAAAIDPSKLSQRDIVQLR